MKKLLIGALTVALGISLFGCAIQGSDNQVPKEEQQSNVVNQNDVTSTNANNQVSSVVYENKDYGFSFALPDTWKGYTIVTDKWEGRSVDESLGEGVIRTGDIIKIRHPEWTNENPRQDIPIMVFTLSDWDLVKNEKLAVSAAPIAPSELGRNSKYVFALPARYNFAFPNGYEEVEEILKGNPLKPTE